MGRRPLRSGSLAALFVTLLAAVANPAPAAAQTAVLVDGGRMLEMRLPDTRIQIPLGCTSSWFVIYGARVYVAGRRCGLLRVIIAPGTVRRAEWFYRGHDVQRVVRNGVEVRADIAVPGGHQSVLVERTDRPPRATMPPIENGESIPVEADTPEPVEVHVYRERPAVREDDPNVVTPPRRGDSWEVGGTLLTSLAFGQPSVGGGLITRAHLVYRAEFPLVIRADLMPLTMSVADAGLFGGLVMLSVGLDVHGFGVGFGAGIGSNNRPSYYNRGDYYENEHSALPVLAPSIRFGVADGLHLSARAGFYVGKLRTDFALTEVWSQIPLVADWALTLRFAYSISGNVEGMLGMRIWVQGRGEAESIALRVGAGIVHTFRREPRNGTISQPMLSFVGPAIGVGIDARF